MICQCFVKLINKMFAFKFMIFAACCIPNESSNTLLYYFISELVTDLLQWRWIVLIGHQEKDIDPKLVEFLFQQNVSVICFTSESKHTLHDVIREHGSIPVILLPPHQVFIKNFINSCRIKWVVVLPPNNSNTLSPIQIFNSVRSLHILFASFRNEESSILQVPSTESNALVTVNEWNTSDGFANDTSFLSCSIRPLRQIRVAMEKHFPFFRIVKSSPLPRGSDIKLLNALAEALYFSYEIVRPPDGSWGDLNGTEWTGMIRMLVMNEADVAMSGMTVTYNRYTAVRFSTPYAYDRITFVTKRPSRKPKTWAIFWPYTFQVWMLIGICIIIISILMTFLRNALKPRKRRTVHFQDTALYMFQAVLSQGYYNASETRCRILMSFWWGFCITVVAGYNGSLMSFMAHPGYNPSLDTVAQLVHAIRNRNFAVGTIKNSADYTVFKDSTQRDLRIIFKSMHADPQNLVLHDVDGLWECMKRRYAYIGGELTVRADIWDPSLFLFGKDSFLQYGYAIAFAPHFEHISLFDHKIRQLQEGGIVKKWMEDIIERQQLRGMLNMKASDDDEDEDSMHILSIDDVQGAFAILSIGLILASIVCTVEYQMHAYTLRRKRKNLKRY